MNILPVRSIKLTHSSCVRCGFWRSRPFQACFTITVIPVKKEKPSLKQQKSQKTKILFRVKILNSSSRNLRLLPTFRGRKNRLSFIRLTEFKQFT